MVSFLYNLKFFEKIKIVEGKKWNPASIEKWRHI